MTLALPTCYYCGHTVEDKDPQSSPKHNSLTRDHIVPRCDGGTDAAANRVIACFSCDQTKASGDAVAFAEAVKKHGRPGDAYWGVRGAMPKWLRISGYDPKHRV